MNNEHRLNISWSEPEVPNGYITEYILFRDNEEIVNFYYNTDGYYTNDYLSNEYFDTIDDLDTNYEYKLAYSNSIGSIISNPQNYFMYNRIPHNINNYSYTNLTNSSVILNWIYDNSSLLPLFEYSLNNSDYNQIINITSNNNFYTHQLLNLSIDSHYYVSLRAKYNDFFIGNESLLSFKTLSGLSNNSDYVPHNPGITPNDIPFWYWYIILAGVLGFLLLICLYVNCCSSRKKNIEPTVTYYENSNRTHNNPIYENQDSAYNDETLYGDFSIDDRTIINACYNYPDDNSSNNIVDTKSLEFSIPHRKITKRRSFGKINDTLQRKESLMDEIRERVPDIVPKNMLRD